MGLTSNSTGLNILNDTYIELKSKSNYTIALAGNPNVGKSTIFNSLTGLKQHTGNWPGKTVSNAFGVSTNNNKQFLFVDLPGTYSLISNSEEEEIARDYICFGNPDIVVVVVDATNLQRCLPLVLQVKELTQNVIVCVNLLDEAKKKKIKINLNRLSKLLELPVIGTIAKKKNSIIQIYNEIVKFDKKRNNNNNNNNIGKNTKDAKDAKELNNRFLNKIKNKQLDDNYVIDIVNKSAKICSEVCSYDKKEKTNIDIKIDKILTSKKFGIPIMIAFLGIIFWLTIVGSNYPSQILFNFFSYIQTILIQLFSILPFPEWINNLFIYGIYQTVTWIISVMLPPMAIFFPLFTFLEDLGFLPRFAFNTDGFFSKCGTSGKQMITMCMGFGCNAAGVVGTRIFESKKEKIIASVTNSFVPCNGRYPFLITISTIFLGGLFSGHFKSIIATLSVILIILIGIFLSMFISNLISKLFFKNDSSTFILELPPYRRPQMR